MSSVPMAALSAPLLAVLVVAACGGTVVVDEEPPGPAGGGGSGNGSPSGPSGPSGPSSGPGSNPAGTGGVPGTSTATGTPGTGGSGLAAACNDACDAIQNCTTGDCVGPCAAASTTCVAEREAYLVCIAELTPPTCNMPVDCWQHFEAWLQCESLCPNGLGWSGSYGENGECFSQLDDCGFSVVHEVQCQPSDPGLVSCECVESGQTVGKCVDDQDSSCDPVFGCCAPLFFVPG